MKLQGRILSFEKVNLNRDIFYKDCKLTIPEKVPLTWDFNLYKPIGIAEVTVDNEGLIATAETFSNEELGVTDIRGILTDDQIGAGGHYTGVKRHEENGVIVIDEARLAAVGLVLAPVREEYLLKLVEEKEE